MAQSRDPLVCLIADICSMPLMGCFKKAEKASKGLERFGMWYVGG